MSDSRIPSSPPATLVALVLMLLACPGPACAADNVLRIPMKEVTASGTGRDLGVVTVTSTTYGAVFTPRLEGLEPGLHGFHVHTNPDCAPASKDGKMSPAEAAGGHYDPEGSGEHGAPWGTGHRGDLPPLFVDAQGRAAQPVLAPRLRVADVQDRALMIHAGGDNHADHPKPLGGGGARVACGVAP